MINRISTIHTTPIVFIGELGPKLPWVSMVPHQETKPSGPMVCHSAIAAGASRFTTAVLMAARGIEGAGRQVLGPESGTDGGSC